MRDPEDCHWWNKHSGVGNHSGPGPLREVWRETLYRGRGLEKKDLLPAFLPVVLLLLVSSEDCRIPQTVFSYVFAKVWSCLQEITHRWGPLSFLLLFLKSLPSAHNNGARLVSGLPRCLLKLVT